MLEFYLNQSLIGNYIMNLYKVTSNNNTLYIHANSWFEIFNSLYSNHKLNSPHKVFKGASIIPIRKSSKTETLEKESKKANLIHQTQLFINLPHFLKLQAH